MPVRKSKILIQNAATLRSARQRIDSIANRRNRLMKLAKLIFIKWYSIMYKSNQNAK